jgi:heme A synthase
VRRRIALAAGLLVLQITLGALTVWHLLAYWTVTSHLLVGNAIAATFAWTALELASYAGAEAEPSHRGRRGHHPASAARSRPRSRRSCFQLVLGGLVSSRYAGMSCPEWPTCNGGVWYPVAARAGRAAPRAPHERLSAARRADRAVADLPAASAPRALDARGRGDRRTQVAVGIANVLSKLPVEITGLHSALAAALVADHDRRRARRLVEGTARSMTRSGPRMNRSTLLRWRRRD